MAGQRSDLSMITRQKSFKGLQRFLWVLGIVCFMVAEVWGLDLNAPVKSIDVQGQSLIDVQSIESRLTLKVNDPYSPEIVRKQIQLIYDMGFFDDVQVETESVVGGVALTLFVREKPFITEIVFDGNEELSDDNLLEKISVKSQSFLDQGQVKEGAESIEKAYEEDGYYNVKAIPIIQSLTENRKRLTYFIEEGRQIQITDITLEGNSVLDKSEILSGVANREHSWFFSWFTDAGILNRDELPNDVERIREVYMNHGYLNVQVSQPELTLSEDKEGLQLAYRIVEGEPYHFEEVAYRGNVLFEEDELRAESVIVPGEVFQRTLLREEVTRVTDLYGTQGYSFAEVIPSVSTDPEKKTAVILLNIEEGQLMKIREIHITGNDKTRDNVIRRELRVEEQQSIDTVAMKRSFQRLNNLNYFETVEILPKQISENEVDLEVKVKEKPTGSFSIGGGFSTLDQFVAIANVTEGNLFGKGWVARIRGQLGQRRTLGLVSLRDPAFLVSRDSVTSLQFDAFSTRTDFLTFIDDRQGGSLTLGRNLSEYVAGNISLFGELIRIVDPSVDAPPLILQQTGRQSSTGIRTNIIRDTRDYFLDPRTGWRHSLGLDFATKVLGGTNYFYKIRVDSLKYTPLFFDIRHMIRGRFGFLEGLGGNPIPVPERFFVGGINTLRGFQFGRAGPVTVSNTPNGSSRQFIINNDLIFPISREAKVNGVLFFDYGTGYDSNDQFDFFDLRKTAGIEGRWISPFGPLRAAWGVNLDPRTGERRTVFEFSVGNVF